MALLLAFASAEEFDLLGITAVAGNVPLARTEDNARRIRDLAGRPEVPVYAGCPRPMVREPVSAEYIHGETGIDGADLPEPSRPAEAAHAVDYLVDTLSAAPEADHAGDARPPHQCRARHRQEPGRPRQRARDRHHGGRARPRQRHALRPSSTSTPTPTPRTWCFEAGVPLTMIGLDVTHQAIATPPRLEAIRALGSAPAAAVCGMLDLYGAQERRGLPPRRAHARSLRHRLPAGARPLRGAATCGSISSWATATASGARSANRYGRTGAAAQRPRARARRCRRLLRHA